MNSRDQFQNGSMDIRQYAKKYFGYLAKLLDAIDIDAISQFVDEMEDAREKGKTIFFIGNGGSASTASHMANDFGACISKELVNAKPFKALSLTDNSAVMLSVANDVGYESLFVDQLKVHYREGDKLVAISASGNSLNVIRAAEWMKSQGGSVLSLVGFDGGKLKEISDVCIHVRSDQGEYGPVEDIHLIMDHLMANWLQICTKNKEQERLSIL